MSWKAIIAAADQRQNAPGRSSARRGRAPRSPCLPIVIPDEPVDKDGRDDAERDYMEHGVGTEQPGERLEQGRPRFPRLISLLREPCRHQAPNKQNHNRA